MSTPENRPPLRGIHDLKFAVSDLDESLRFYERALGAKHVLKLDHTRDDGTRFAAVVEVPSLGTLLQLRLDPERAGRQAMFDPLAIAVDDRAALERWDAPNTLRVLLRERTGKTTAAQPSRHWACCIRQSSPRCAGG
jgi:catechol 2,3-dioxygenase-like lactoylglutathione lyase family enzyme